MKQDFYLFEYQTKTKNNKLIGYGACSLRSAMRAFNKNTRSTGLSRVWKNGYIVIGY